MVVTWTGIKARMLWCFLFHHYLAEMYEGELLRVITTSWSLKWISYYYVKSCQTSSYHQSTPWQCQFITQSFGVRYHKCRLTQWVFLVQQTSTLITEGLRNLLTYCVVLYFLSGTSIVQMAKASFVPIKCIPAVTQSPVCVFPFHYFPHNDAQSQVAMCWCKCIKSNKIPISL